MAEDEWGEDDARASLPRVSFPLFRAARVAVAANLEARERRDTLRRESVEQLVGLFDEFSTTTMAAKQQQRASPSRSSSPSSPKSCSADGESPTEGWIRRNKYFSFDRFDSKSAGSSPAASASDASPFTPSPRVTVSSGVTTTVNVQGGNGSDEVPAGSRAAAAGGSPKSQVLYEDMAALVVDMCGDNVVAGDGPGAGVDQGRSEAFFGVTVNEELHNSFHVFVLRPPRSSGGGSMSLMTTTRHRPSLSEDLSVPSADVQRAAGSSASARLKCSNEDFISFKLAGAVSTKPSLTFRLTEPIGSMPSLLHPYSPTTSPQKPNQCRRRRHALQVQGGVLDISGDQKIRSFFGIRSISDARVTISDQFHVALGRLRLHRTKNSDNASASGFLNKRPKQPSARVIHGDVSKCVPDGNVMTSCSVQCAASICRGDIMYVCAITDQGTLLINSVSLWTEGDGRDGSAARQRSEGFEGATVAPAERGWVEIMTGIAEVAACKFFWPVGRSGQEKRTRVDAPLLFVVHRDRSMVIFDCLDSLFLDESGSGLGCECDTLNILTVPSPLNPKKKTFVPSAADTSECCHGVEILAGLGGIEYMLVLGERGAGPFHVLQLTFESLDGDGMDVIGRIPETDATAVTVEYHPLQDGWFGSPRASTQGIGSESTGNKQGAQQRQLSVHRMDSNSSVLVASLDPASSTLDVYDSTMGKMPIFRHEMPRGTMAFSITDSLIFAAHPVDPDANSNGGRNVVSVLARFPPPSASALGIGAARRVQASSPSAFTPMVILQAIPVAGSVTGLRPTCNGVLVQTNQAILRLSLASAPEPIVTALLSRATSRADMEATLIAAAFRVDVIRLYKLAGEAAIQGAAWHRAVQLLKMTNADDVDIVLMCVMRGNFATALSLRDALRDGPRGTAGSDNGALYACVNVASEAGSQLALLAGPFPAARAATEAIVNWSWTRLKNSDDIHAMNILRAFALMAAKIYASGPESARNILRGETAIPSSNFESDAIDALEGPWGDTRFRERDVSGTPLYKWICTWLPSLADLRCAGSTRADGLVFSEFVRDIGVDTMEGFLHTLPGSDGDGRDVHNEDGSRTEPAMLSPGELYRMQSRLIGLLYLEYAINIDSELARGRDRAMKTTALRCRSQPQPALEVFIKQNVGCLGVDWVIQCCERLGNVSGAVAVCSSVGQYEEATEHFLRDRERDRSCLMEDDRHTIMHQASFGDDDGASTDDRGGGSPESLLPAPSSTRCDDLISRLLMLLSENVSGAAAHRNEIGAVLRRCTLEDGFEGQLLLRIGEVRSGARELLRLLSNLDMGAHRISPEMMASLAHASLDEAMIGRGDRFNETPAVPADDGVEDTMADFISIVLPEESITGDGKIVFFSCGHIVPLCRDIFEKELDRLCHRVQSRLPSDRGATVVTGLRLEYSRASIGDCRLPCPECLFTGLSDTLSRAGIQR